RPVGGILPVCQELAGNEDLGIAPGIWLGNAEQVATPLGVGGVGEDGIHVAGREGTQSETSGVDGCRLHTTHGCSRVIEVAVLARFRGSRIANSTLSTRHPGSSQVTHSGTATTHSASLPAPPCRSAYEHGQSDQPPQIRVGGSSSG